MQRVDLPMFPFTVPEFSETVDTGLIPEVAVLSQIIESNPWHDNQPVLDHTKRVVEHVDGLLSGRFWFDRSLAEHVADHCSQHVGMRTQRELILAAAMLHDIGKSSTFVVSGGSSACPDHELVGASGVPSILSRFSGWYPEDGEYLRQLVLLHGTVHAAANRAEAEQRYRDMWGKRFACAVGDMAIPLIVMGLADTMGGSLAVTDPSFLTARRRTLERWLGNQFSHPARP